MGWRAKRNGTSFISNQATTEATGGDAIASAERELFRQLRSGLTPVVGGCTRSNTFLEVSQRICYCQRIWGLRINQWVKLGRNKDMKEIVKCYMGNTEINTFQVFCP